MSFSLLDAVALEQFSLGQVPTSVQLTVTSGAIVAADPDRAYAVIAMVSITGGNAFIASNQTALADKGRLLQLGVPVFLFGPEAVNGICDTAAQTAEIAIQEYKLGVPNPGTMV